MPQIRFQFAWRPQTRPRNPFEAGQMQPMADDHTRMTASDVMERLRAAMRDLSSILTTGDAKIDAEVLAAEQALRRAMAGVKAAIHAVD
jgi:hypothetical protein